MCDKGESIIYICFTFPIQMKNDFRKMEDEMNKLDTTLTSVTEFSDKVNTALHEKRSHISQLSGVHTLLHKVHQLMCTKYFFLTLARREGTCLHKVIFILELAIS